MTSLRLLRPVMSMPCRLSALCLGHPQLSTPMVLTQQCLIQRMASHAFSTQSSASTSASASPKASSNTWTNGDSPTKKTNTTTPNAKSNTNTSTRTTTGTTQRRPAPSSRSPSSKPSAKPTTQPTMPARSSEDMFESSLLKRVLHIRRVSKTTSGGKVRTISAIVVVGNRNGLAGYGEGRAADSPAAVMKATRLAIKNLQVVQRFEKRTLFGSVGLKYGSVDLRMDAAPPGYGIVANNHIHEICRCAGISDMYAKVYGSHNPMNVIKATFEAFRLQKTPREIARARGKKLVDVAGMYYGGIASS